MDDAAMNGAATDIDVIDDVPDKGPSESPGAMGEVSRSQAVTKRLLDAAVEVFAERGFEAARVAEIARRADLTTGAIYARWRGKRALIVDAVRHVVPQFMHLSVAAADAPAPETLVALGTSLMDTLNARSRDVMLEAFVSARRDDDFRAAVSRSMEEEAVRLGEIVSRGKAEGSIDPDLSTRAIVACYQALGLGMHLVVSARSEGGRVPRAEWEALIARLVAAAGPPASGSRSSLEE